ncbi:MAG: ABC transporter permease [Anaerovoracaceae bacterium]
MENLNDMRKKRSALSGFLEIARRYRKSRAAMIGLIILLVFVLAAIFADLIVPYERAIEQISADRLQGPSAAHWFGTDGMGRDLFARIVHGSRNSIGIALIVSIIALAGGVILGALSGYYGRMTDNVIMRLVDIFQSIPSTLMALAIVTALGISFRNLIIALSISGIMSMTRIVRACILSVSEQEYVEAAYAYGCSDARIIARYILPNALGPIIVQFTLEISIELLAVSGLSFLGLGVKAPTPEWGAILADARTYMQMAPHLLYFPGVAIVLTALGFNLAGDGLRDALDPRLKD